jgi:hypothetical protein
MNPVHHSISIANLFLRRLVAFKRVAMRWWEAALAVRMALHPISNLNPRASFLDLHRTAQRAAFPRSLKQSPERAGFYGVSRNVWSWSV